MSLRYKIDDNLVNLVVDTAQLNTRSTLAEDRANLMDTMIRKTNGDLASALKSTFFHDASLFEDVAEIQASNGKKGLKNNFERYKKYIVKEDSGNFRIMLPEGENMERGALSGSAGGGNNDFTTLFVENFIQKRLEKETNSLEIEINKLTQKLTKKREKTKFHKQNAK